MTFIVKTGEVWTAPEFKYCNDGTITDLSERGRLICPGDDSFCGWYVYAATILNTAAKTFDESYRIGDNLTELMNKINEHRGKFTSPKVVCMDGSAWDSTQNRHMLEIVDHALINAASKLLYSFIES